MRSTDLVCGKSKSPSLEREEGERERGRDVSVEIYYSKKRHDRFAVFVQVQTMFPMRTLAWLQVAYWIASFCLLYL